LDFSLIGERIQELRKQIGLSQGKLGEGICTQAQISKIENGEVYPYANTLFLLSKKLGVDCNYFFDIGSTPNLDYVQEAIDKMDSLRAKQGYEQLYKLVLSLEKSPVFLKDINLMQYVLWHKGICLFELHGSYDTAVDTLSQAMELTGDEEIWSETKIQIGLSITAIQFTNNNLLSAMDFALMVNRKLEQLPVVKNKTIQVKIYYHIARIYSRLKECLDSIEMCKKGIDYCIEKEILYLFGELHYQIGYNYELLGERDLAIHYLTESLFLFKTKRNNRHVEFIEGKLRTLKSN
jgi:transcriptional regulator with XRE-family HTH domain